MTIKKLSGIGVALLMTFSMSSVYAAEEVVETQTQLQTQTQTQEKLQTQTQERLKVQTREKLNASASKNAVTEQHQYKTRQQRASSTMTRQRTPRSSTGGSRR